jgi:hypothetical protein
MVFLIVFAVLALHAVLLAVRPGRGVERSWCAEPPGRPLSGL